MGNSKNIKKMHEFIDRLFKRSKQPLEELKKIYSIHPAFFTYIGCVEYINNYLKLFDYELNPEFISKLKGTLYSCWHEEDPEPIYGPCYGPAFPVGCGYSGVNSGSSYGGGCGLSGGGMCMSEHILNGNVKLLIKRKHSKKNIGNSNIYGGLAY